MRDWLLVVGYLLAIVAANVAVAVWGTDAVIWNALLFIGFDITIRDVLHRRWEGSNLLPRMLALVLTGSLISAALNRSVVPIAIASFVAFLCSGVVDMIVFSLLRNTVVMKRINISNIFAAVVDSFIFLTLAFGLPLILPIFFGQVFAKIAGGFIWSMILTQRGIYART